MRAALDTNLFVYAFGLNGPDRQQEALAILGGASGDSIVPVQVLGEAFRVLVSKAKLSSSDAASQVTRWRSSYVVKDTTTRDLDTAITLAAKHKLQIWDAIILSVASNAGCHVLLSEDFQSSAVWNGVRIVNPFDPASRSIIDQLGAP